jgi:hypothetical protein
MNIKMKAQLTGTRDGVSWPSPGETVDLPDHEAAKLCAAGLAEPVNTRGKSDEKATAPAAETRKSAAKKSTGRRK